MVFIITITYQPNFFMVKARLHTYRNFTSHPIRLFRERHFTNGFRNQKPYMIINKEKIQICTNLCNEEENTVNYMVVNNDQEPIAVNILSQSRLFVHGSHGLTQIDDIMLKDRIQLLKDCEEIAIVSCNVAAILNRKLRSQSDLSHFMTLSENHTNDESEIETTGLVPLIQSKKDVQLGLDENEYERRLRYSGDSTISSFFE